MKRFTSNAKTPGRKGFYDSWHPITTERRTHDVRHKDLPPVNTLRASSLGAFALMISISFGCFSTSC
jgi:hypothetical protein